MNVKCRSCSGTNMVNAVSLAAIPIAHEFSSDAEQAMARKTWPLDLEACKDCGVAQFAAPIPPEILYSEYNYCFSSWKSQPHIIDEVNIINELKPSGCMLEIGCNDGTFLTQFQQSGDYQCVGLEPNKVSAQQAREKGFEVINAFFEHSDKELQQLRPDIIIGRQVLEHIIDVQSFFETAQRKLALQGLLCIEVPNTEIAIETGDLSCLWEEHVNYFTPTSLKNLFLRHGFEVLAQRKYPFSGEALFYVGRKVSKGSLLPAQKASDQAAPYVEFKDNIALFAHKLKQVLDKAKAKQLKVVLYGSGCRSSVMLNGLNIQDRIDIIVDDQAEKQGLFMPKVPIKIRTLDALSAEQRYLFLLAVNSENDDKVTANISARNLASPVIVSVHSPKNIIAEMEETLAKLDTL